MVQPPPKLGLIAGGGKIPALVRQACIEGGRPLYIAALKGFCDPATVLDADHDWFDLPQVGRLLKALHKAEVQDVCLCGRVARPDFSSLKPDWKGASLLPAIIRAAVRGDDALLRVVLDVFEADGFRVVGADMLVQGLLAQPRSYTRCQPDDGMLNDIRLGKAAARELGVADIGQAAVASHGAVVGLEDAAGTDDLLQRMAVTTAARGGVLVKCAKPQQDRRVDLPTVGLTTVRNAAAAGLAGIAIEAGSALLVDAAATAAAADSAGLFLIGFQDD